MNLAGPAKSRVSLLDKMSSDPWFASLPLEERHRLLGSTAQLRLAAGESLFRRGDPPDGFYGVVDGRLKASNVRGDGKEGILAILEAGNWFGQMSAITGWPRIHDVVALGRAHVLRLPLAAFNSSMQSATFARAIAELESRHTGVLYQMYDEATLHCTRTRVVRRLMRLARGDATMAAESRPDIPVSQETLAMMLGISRQTLALELKAMVEQGAVAVRYGHVEILSMESLQSFDDDRGAMRRL